MDLNGDGSIEIITAVLNEHGDTLTHLVLFSADDGKRLFDQAGLSILAAEDLDGDGVNEVLLARKDGGLRIANWNGHDFVDRCTADNVTPLIVPAQIRPLLSIIAAPTTHSRARSGRRS